jgi:uncharacterized membrane protein YkgB
VTSLVKLVAKTGLLREGLDQHIVRASMVLIFVLFGYQKWFEYEAQMKQDVASVVDPRGTGAALAGDPRAVEAVP